MKRILLSIITIAIMTSCSSLVYDVALSSVEAPADVKEQYGETKIITREVDGKTKYKYEDDYIDILWYVDDENFSFVLTNKTEYSIKIPWDDVTFVDTEGGAGRVMHSGVNYIDRGAHQPASVIPKGTYLKDVIQPTDNVYYEVGEDKGWKRKKLFNYYINKKNVDILKTIYIGNSVTVVLPILIKGVCNEYVFKFEIADITAK